jgi:hypothetical protein
MKNKILLFSALTILWLLGSALFALDLKFTSAIRMSPASPAVGNTITFSVSFIPQGGTVTSFKITGGVDTTQVYERTFASIPADATRTVSFTWTSTAGNHTAWFVLDPDHLMGDANYGNNRVELAFSGGILFEAMRPVVVAHAAVFKPDLIISYVKFTKDTNRDDKYFYTLKFKNQGGGCIGAFNFKLYAVNPVTGEDLCSTCLHGRFAAMSPLCALSAGQEKTLYGFILKSEFSKSQKEDCPGFSFFPKNKYFNSVYLIVDHDNHVDESNETNNQTSTYELVWKDECD